ncbi:hypothetical protein E2C01_052548 [Portunus trituberculatus]|uniref:Uncharacterized protein n=1 Tax=Portunus trituberculatus TaxID=210409 RepID=A0A5B7GHZ2_PORTR|nr:hypothetical protein [Portunus trituberculatus]
MREGTNKQNLIQTDRLEKTQRETEERQCQPKESDHQLYLGSDTRRPRYGHTQANQQQKSTRLIMASKRSPPHGEQTRPPLHPLLPAPRAASRSKRRYRDVYEGLSASSWLKGGSECSRGREGSRPTRGR